MKKIAYVFLLVLLAGPVMAHEDHDHGAPITKSEAVNIAQNTVQRLTEKDGGLGFGQLPASWASLPAESVKVDKAGEGYYIVAATNSEVGKTLYILISSEEGKAFDANFSGEFKDLAQ